MSSITQAINSFDNALGNNPNAAAVRSSDNSVSSSGITFADNVASLFGDNTKAMKTAMWEAKNKDSWRVESLLKAGINPMVAYSQNSSPSGYSSSIQSNTANPIKDLTKIIGSVLFLASIL